MRIHRTGAPISLAAASALVLIAACSSDSTGPTPPPDVVQLSAAQVNSLDSSVTVAAINNPTNPDLRSLLDSTLDVLAAGVQAKTLDVSTDLTTLPLKFVGIHRAYTIPTGGSFSTWTVVGFDDPSHLTTLIDVGGFAQGGPTPPSSVSGAVAAGGSARFIQLADGGAVTEWFDTAGPLSFVSDSTTPGGPCPGFNPIPRVTCTTEIMHVQFDIQASGSSDGTQGTRHATLATTVDVPTMRLDYTP